MKKRCYSCNRELEEDANPADPISGWWGACDSCERFIFERDAALKKRLCSRPAEPEKTP